MAAWGETQGPIGATVLSLERLGWTAASWDCWIDDEGCERRLLDFAPKLFRGLMYQSVQRHAQRSLASVFRPDLAGLKDRKTLVEQAILRLELSGGACSSDPMADAHLLLQELDKLDAYFGQSKEQYGMGASERNDPRACLDYVREYMRSSAKPVDGKNAVATVATNALWTRQRLSDAGYEVDDTMCERCGTDEDTLHHRLWRCPDDQCVKMRWDAIKHSPLARHGAGDADRGGLPDNLVQEVITQAMGGFPASAMYN